MEQLTEIIFIVCLFSLFALFGGTPDLADSIMSHIEKSDQKEK